MGVLWELRSLGVLSGSHVKMAGASTGALAVATYNSSIDVESTMAALLELARDTRSEGVFGRLGRWVGGWVCSWVIN